jgi:2-iminobutanoate/2-iminopropanoate deaminase
MVEAEDDVIIFVAKFIKMKKTSLVILFALLLTSCEMSRPLVVVDSKDAPKAIGPYCQAIKAGDLVFCSGQIGLVPATGALAGDDIAAQAQQALKNLAAVVKEAGSDMNHVVKVTIYLKDMNDYAKVNDIYKDYFTDLKPARATVQVAGLPKNALIEMDCIATTGGK